MIVAAASNRRIRLAAFLFIAAVGILTVARFCEPLFPPFLPLERAVAPKKIDGPSWLIWTSTAVHLRQRREIIRSTWQRLYRDIPFQAKFVVGHPGPEWMPIFQQENDTYGDMMMLRNVSGDDHKFATTHKPLTFFKQLQEEEQETGRRWDFVSKLDDDSFLDAGTFYREFLQPRAKATKTLIARRCESPGLYWPAGMFYTMSWDLLNVVTSQYEREPFKLDHEDWPLGKILAMSKLNFDFVQLAEERAFDVVREGMVTKEAILPHKMKKDEEYLWVAQMYDKQGYRGAKLGDVDLEAKVREYASSSQKPNGWRCEGPKQ